VLSRRRGAGRGGACRGRADFRCLRYGPHSGRRAGDRPPDGRAPSVRRCPRPGRCQRCCQDDWAYWISSPRIAHARDWTNDTWMTPAIPPGATALSFGLTVGSVSTITITLQPHTGPHRPREDSPPRARHARLPRGLRRSHKGPPPQRPAMIPAGDPPTLISAPSCGGPLWMRRAAAGLLTWSDTRTRGGARGTRTPTPCLQTEPAPPAAQAECKRPAQKLPFNSVGSGSGRVIQKMISQIPPS
jgi:hypothetical protein